MLVYAALEPISGSVYKTYRCQMIDCPARLGTRSEVLGAMVLAIAAE